MHEDLRRRALESGKTTSRKARSRQASRATSRNTSPQPPVSRPGSSRNETPTPSDDGYSDHSSIGIGSGNVSSEEEALPIIAPDQSLVEIIDSLLDKSTKRQNERSRIYNLTLYNNTKIAMRPDEERDGREAQLASALLKMVKQERSEEETLLALHALSLTCISSTTFASTSAGGGFYDELSKQLKSLMSSSQSVAVKTAAIHTLSTFVFYGGVSDDEVNDTLAYFLDVVLTDGGSIDALDAPAPVHAAIQEYAFLLTRFDDFEDDSNDAVEAFLDQLASSDPDVQIAAGEAIALLYEMSYTPLEEDEEPPTEWNGDHNHNHNGSNNYDDNDNDSGPASHGNLVRRYQAYRRTDAVESQLESLSRGSTLHALSQKNKRAVHAMGADVLDSIRNPAHGPRYHNALDRWGQVFGSTMRVVVSAAGNKGRRDMVIAVDRWWVLLRYQHLVRVLRGGFNAHYLENRLVRESLPGEMVLDGQEDGASRGYAKAMRGKKPPMQHLLKDPWVQ